VRRNLTSSHRSTPRPRAGRSAVSGADASADAGPGHVAIGGKTLRGSRRLDAQAIHVLSAFRADLGAVMELVVAPDQNEITAEMALPEGLAARRRDHHRRCDLHAARELPRHPGRLRRSSGRRQRRPATAEGRESSRPSATAPPRTRTASTTGRRLTDARRLPTAATGPQRLPSPARNHWGVENGGQHPVWRLPGEVLRTVIDEADLRFACGQFAGHSDAGSGLAVIGRNPTR